MDLLTLFSGYKAIIAGLGMIGLGIYQISQGQGEQGIHTIAEGLAVIGLRGGLDQVKTALKP